MGAQRTKGCNVPGAVGHGKALDSSERADLLLLIESTLAINDAEQFLQWTTGPLQGFFPHEMLICGVGRINARSIDIHKFLAHNFPLEYLEEIRQPGGGVLSPTMAAWCAKQEPLLFSPGSAAAQANRDWLSLFDKHGLRNIAAHGMRDLGSGTASYFSFSRIPGNLTFRHAHLLELLVPHLHVALVRALCDAPQPRSEPDSAAPVACISAREREILQWLQQGKTNSEIGQLLHISENTVKNHVQRILVRLRVNNRTQAVAKAIAMRLIQL